MTKLFVLFFAQFVVINYIFYFYYPKWKYKSSHCVLDTAGSSLTSLLLYLYFFHFSIVISLFIYCYFFPPHTLINHTIWSSGTCVGVGYVNNIYFYPLFQHSHGWWGGIKTWAWLDSYLMTPLYYPMDSSSPQHGCS